MRLAALHDLLSLLPLVAISPALTILGCASEDHAPRAVELPDTPAPAFRNVVLRTDYIGDSACVSCHRQQADAYSRHSMARSFQRWTRASSVETPMDTALYHPGTGMSYTVVEDHGALFQVEFIEASDGRRIHELRRRMDFAMGSGAVARTYFTEENGRLFQLPLTWYSRHGWDFSPGYRPNNARFDRLMPNRCIACHSSYPDARPFLEGKYANARPGIGCERCHGPGALHVAERRDSTARAGSFDNSIVNPSRLPLARRLDTCEQCHVHTAVNVLREGKSVFGYMPSEPLRDHWAFFKTAGTIDIVSHADRLRQSPCFLGTLARGRPLECATCHDPHSRPPDRASLSRPCLGCHTPDSLALRLAKSDALEDHRATSNCVNCHMPKMQEQGIPHGTFTEHWIRVVREDDAPAQVRRAGGDPIEPFFERDMRGPDAAVYRAMGRIVYGTLGPDSRVLAAAATELRTLLGDDTTRAGAWFLLGAAYEQLASMDDAIRAHERSVHIDANRPEALRALAHAYAVVGRAPEIVDSLYRAALGLEPALAWIRAEYASFLHAQGRAADAERQYRAALEERPSLAGRWFDLAILYSGTGRDDDASRAYERAVRLDPELAQALTALFEVRSDSGGAVVRSVAPPREYLPVRDRGARAVQARVSADGAAMMLMNLPATAIVQIFQPDGTLLRTLRSQGQLASAWDLRTGRGQLIGPGLLRVRVLGRNTAGQAVPPQTFYIGIIRPGGSRVTADERIGTAHRSR